MLRNLAARALHRRRPAAATFAVAAELVRELAGLGWSWLVVAAGLTVFAVAAGGWMAAATAKAVDSSDRLDNLVTAVGALNAGLMTNVNGGNSVQITTTSSATMHAFALGEFTDSGNTSFLSGLEKLNHLAGQPADGNTGPYWGTGERDFVNNCVGWINNIDGDLQNKGWMN
jgi:hypothetical protein